MSSFFFSVYTFNFDLKLCIFFYLLLSNSLFYSKKKKKNSKIRAQLGLKPLALEPDKKKEPIDVSKDLAREIETKEIEDRIRK